MRSFRFVYCALGALLSLAACGDASSPTPPDVNRVCNGAAPVALRRGEVRALSGGSTLACVAVASAAESTQYLFVTANAAAVPGDRQFYSVTTSSGVSSSTALVPTTAVTRDIIEGRVRENEQRLLAARPATHLSAAFTRRAQTTAAPAPAVGDTLRVHVADASSPALCSVFTDVRAVVKAVTARAVIAQDVAAPARGFTDADFRAIGAEFDQLTYPTVARWFGAPSDINADGHITILYTPQINRLTPMGSLGYVGGFFFASDLLPRTRPGDSVRCDSSNEQEIFYLLAPDPDGMVNGNRFSVQTALESTRGTIAHELQHMVNQGVRQSSTGPIVLETAWLNEGLSHFAEELVGRAARSFADARRLTWNDVLTDLDDFDSFFRQNLIRYRQWMERPFELSPVSSGVANQLGSRGAAWALLRYATDHYSRGDAPAFVRALVAGPEIDVKNLEARTRVPFDELLPGFLVANFADGLVTGLEARYTFPTWSMRDVMTNLNGGLYPLRVVSLPNSVATESPSGSGNYFLWSRAPNAGTGAFRMLANTGTPVEFPGARVYVVRVR
jgi:hypothetical protein